MAETPAATTSDFQRVRELALALCREDRESLMNELAWTLQDPEVEAAWAREIERRLRDIDEGKVELLDEDEADAMVERLMSEPD